MRDLISEAKALEASKDWAGALEIYEQVIKDEPTPLAKFRAGLMCERLEDWEKSRDYYGLALSTNDPAAEWHYRFGYVSERLKDWPSAISSYLAGASKDFPGETLFSEMLDVERRWFIQRRRTLVFVRENLDEIRSRAARRQTAATPDPRTFMYWGQGESDMPPVVRACLRQARANRGDLQFLDDAAVPYFVDIPAKVRAKLSNNRTAFSDVLRFALLSAYGGSWADATCFIVARPEIKSDGVGSAFAYAYKGARISSWYVADRAGGYIATMMYEALLVYWEKHDKLLHYYLLHHIFEALSYLDPLFNDEWMASPRPSAIVAHEVQKKMLSPLGDEDDLAQLLQASAVHKLTYKFDLAKVKPNSLLASIVRR